MALRAWPHWPALWRKAKQIAPWALALLVLALLAHQAGTVDWRAVTQALLQQAPAAMAVAAALALLSHALVSSYHLVARHETGHRLSAPRTLGIAAVATVQPEPGSLVALRDEARMHARAG
jgi:uncharacterized membrane protein YbhN (UPF0104 family)